MFETIPFSGNGIDRLERQRDDPAWLAARRNDPASRFLPVYELRPLVTFGDDGEAALAWQPPKSLAGLPADGPETVLLGEIDGRCHFAVDIGVLDDPQGWSAAHAAKFIDARSIAPSLSAAASGLLAHARTLLEWHARHRFCSYCGGATDSRGGGRERHCSGCDSSHFPRNEPVVIMHISHGQRCLFGRQHHFAPGMWSCLAGFVEPGETVEGAVRREAYEEAGVRIGAVRYVGSQPWPFPASLMLGCLAEAEGETLRVDQRELAAARWFDRDEVVAMLARCDSDATPRLPMRVAIAHHLVRHWLGHG